MIYYLKDTFTNGFNDTTLDFFFILAILSAILIIISKNPIHSILFLISLFIIISLYLISLGLTFLGLSYLLVYVGAVSILFLFILMLINIRISELVSESRNSIFLVLITTFIFSSILPEKLYYTLNTSVKKCIYNNWDNSIIDTSHIASIGNIIYTNFPLLIIITSIILLLAMVGAIIITYNKKKIYD